VSERETGREGGGLARTSQTVLSVKQTPGEASKDRC